MGAGDRVVRGCVGGKPLPFPSFLQVTKAFRKMSLHVHPDKNESPHAEAAFKRVNAACQALLEQAAPAA